MIFFVSDNSKVVSDDASDSNSKSEVLIQESNSADETMPTQSESQEEESNSNPETAVSSLFCMSISTCVI